MQKGLMASSRPDDVVVIVLVTLVIKNQIVSCLWFSASLNSITYLISFMDDDSAKTGFIEPVSLRRSRHTS